MKILLSHGSTDARHSEQLGMLADAVSTLLDDEVDIAFLGDKNLPSGATVLPVFLGAGQHVTKDVPAMVAAANSCSLLPALGGHAEQLARLVYDQVTAESRRVNALFALYRFAGFEAVTAALHERIKRCSLVAMASLHSEPSVTSVLKHWQAHEITPVTLQPMLLFEGKSMDRLRGMTKVFDVTLQPVLSACDGFPQLVADCFMAADDMEDDTKESV